MPPCDNQAVRAALAATPLAQFIEQRAASTQRTPLVTVRPTETVSSALARLSAARVLSAPVLDAAGSCVGTFSLNDVVVAILERAYSDLTDPAAVAARPRLAEAELQTLAPVVMNAFVADVDALAGPANLWFKVSVEKKRPFFSRFGLFFVHPRLPNPKTRPPTLPNTQHDKDATLLDVVRSGLRVGDARRAAHRVPVFGVGPGAPSPDGPALTWTVTDIVSASDIIAFIHAHKTEFAGALATKLDDVDLPSSPMATVDAGAPALVAFATMRACGAPAAALLDDAGVAVGVLSFSDVRGLDARSLAALARSAAELAAASAAGTSPWDPATAPFGGRADGAATGDWGTVLKHAPPVTVPADATVGDVVDKVAAARVHRAFVVNGSGQPIGVVELNDVLRVLTSE